MQPIQQTRPRQLESRMTPASASANHNACKKGSGSHEDSPVGRATALRLRHAVLFPSVPRAVCAAGSQAGWYCRHGACAPGILCGSLGGRQHRRCRRRHHRQSPRGRLDLDQRSRSLVQVGQTQRDRQPSRFPGNRGGHLRRRTDRRGRRRLRCLDLDRGSRCLEPAGIRADRHKPLSTDGIGGPFGRWKHSDRRTSDGGRNLRGDRGIRRSRCGMDTERRRLDPAGTGSDRHCGDLELGARLFRIALRRRKHRHRGRALRRSSTFQYCLTTSWFPGRRLDLDA